MPKPNLVTRTLGRMADSVRSYIGSWPMSDPYIAKLFGGGPTSTGVGVSEHTALTYSAFWAAVAIISGDVASLPLSHMKLEKDGSKHVYDDGYLHELVHDSPNPEMSSMVFRETVTSHILTWGNGYAEIERNGLGRAVALWPLTPDRVTPFRDGRALRYRVTQPSGGQTILPPANVLHIPGLGFDGVTGYSVVQQARESISMGLATERFGGSFFGNGTTFGGVLSHPNKLTLEDKQSIRESVNALHQGVDRAHQFLIVGHGMKYEKFGIPPNDAQFLETRKFQVSEIARWFQIPPHKLGDLERATFTNIEQQDIEYYRACLRRWLVRWEQELNRKLIPSLERYQQYFKFNTDGFLRGDSTSRAEYYSKMFNIGVYSLNDILDLEDMNKIGADGDVHFVPSTMKPIEQIINPPTPPAVSVVDGGNVPPKELPPADQQQQGRSLHDVLSEIATNAATFSERVTAEREAVANAERERHAAELARLLADRTALESQLAAATEAREAERQRLATVTETAQRHEVDATEARSELEQALAREREVTERANALAAEKDAIRVKAETELADAMARVTAATQERTAIEHQATAERAERERARAEVDALASKLPVLEHAAEEARMAAASAAANATETEQRFVKRREEELDRLTRVIAAHRTLIEDVVTRLIRPEVDRARRRQSTPDNLRKWLQAFYVTHRDVCAEALYPSLLTHLAWKRSTEDPHTVARAMAEAHCAESERQLNAVIDGSEAEDFHPALERLLQRWEQERPRAIADQVLQEEIAYVAAYR